MPSRKKLHRTSGYKQSAATVFDEISYVKSKRMHFYKHQIAVVAVVVVVVHARQTTSAAVCGASAQGIVYVRQNHN